MNDMILTVELARLMRQYINFEDTEPTIQGFMEWLELQDTSPNKHRYDENGPESI